MYSQIFASVVILTLVKTNVAYVAIDSVASDVAQQISTLSTTITTASNAAYTSYNAYSNKIAASATAIKTQSISDVTTSVTAINQTIGTYLNKAKSAGLDITSCTSDASANIAKLATNEKSIYTCINGQQTAFETTVSTVEMQIGEMSQVVVGLQTDAGKCLNDEVCLIGVKQKCQNYQTYLPLEIELYNDGISQDYAVVTAQLDKCSTDNNIAIQKSQILSDLAVCFQKIVISKTPSDTSSTTTSPTNPTEGF